MKPGFLSLLIITIVSLSFANLVLAEDIEPVLFNDSLDIILIDEQNNETGDVVIMPLGTSEQNETKSPCLSGDWMCYTNCMITGNDCGIPFEWLVLSVLIGIFGIIVVIFMLIVAFYSKRS